MPCPKMPARVRLPHPGKPGVFFLYRVMICDGNYLCFGATMRVGFPHILSVQGGGSCWPGHGDGETVRVRFPGSLPWWYHLSALFIFHNSAQMIKKGSHTCDVLGLPRLLLSTTSCYTSRRRTLATSPESHRGVSGTHRHHRRWESPFTEFCTIT